MNTCASVQMPSIILSDPLPDNQPLMGTVTFNPACNDKAWDIFDMPEDVKYHLRAERCDEHGCRPIGEPPEFTGPPFASHSWTEWERKHQWLDTFYQKCLASGFDPTEVTPDECLAAVTHLKQQKKVAALRRELMVQEEKLSLMPQSYGEAALQYYQLKEQEVKRKEFDDI
jgi:hypothetical protein